MLTNAVGRNTQFPILIFCQNYERTLKCRSHSNIVVSSSIIVCFYSYKLSIGSTFCMNLIFEGVVVSQWTSFHFVFSIRVQFLLSCWLRQCWSIWHVNMLYCSFLFRKDWLILNQTKCSLTNKIFDKQMCTQGKHTSLTVSIKFINGKIWVFTPLWHFWLRITFLAYILKR